MQQPVLSLIISIGVFEQVATLSVYDEVNECLLSHYMYVYRI